MTRPPERGDPLTPRETEVRDLLCDGLSAKEVGRELNISHRTVETHRSRVLTKVGARNAVHLIKITYEGAKNA